MLYDLKRAVVLLRPIAECIDLAFLSLIAGHPDS
jgi:hypothetical protein